MQKDTTIYFYQMSNMGASYETPKKETFENYKERKGFTTDKQAIDHLNAWGGKYFIGTQTEYDALGVFNIIYYKLNELANKIPWQWIFYLKDGSKGTAPTIKELIDRDDVTIITKAEYDALIIKNTIDNAFALKLSNLKMDSSPKLAAYIAKGEDYINLHIDKVSSGTLSTFVGTNGKIDMNALKVVMQGHQDKINSMVLIVQLFAKYIVAIETGTEASLKELPFDTPTTLNAEIDSLWKIEVDKERKELSSKLNIPMTTFAIIDKYLITVSGDEPEIK